GTLVNALLHHDPRLEALPRAGIVHRLDKDTSGAMVIARSLRAHTALTDQLSAREVHRQYLALVVGALVAGGTADAPIDRHPRSGPWSTPCCTMIRDWRRCPAQASSTASTRTPRVPW